MKTVVALEEILSKMQDGGSSFFHQANDSHHDLSPFQEAYELLKQEATMLQNKFSELDKKRRILLQYPNTLTEEAVNKLLEIMKNVSSAIFKNERVVCFLEHFLKAHSPQESLSEVTAANHEKCRQTR